MFEQVSALIDKKEAPGNLEQAIGLLEGLAAEQPQNDMVRGKLAHAYYYRGKFAPEDSKQREQMFEHGVSNGERALELNPRALYGSFWYGSNLGMLGLCRGVLQSLRSVEPMRRALEVVLQANERFFFAGPHRGLGRLFHKLPPWPVSIGKKSKAEEHLTRAVDLAPQYFPNRLFLGELYVDMKNKKAARPHLEYIIDTPVNPDHAIEDGDYQRQARSLHQRL